MEHELAWPLDFFKDGFGIDFGGLLVCGVGAELGWRGRWRRESRSTVLILKTKLPRFAFLIIIYSPILKLIVGANLMG